MTCCQFAPNGWLLATGASNGLFLLFDVFTGECVAKKRIGPAAHDGGINTIAVQPLQQTTPTVGGAGGGKEVYQFATAGNDNSVKFWQVECDGVANGKREFEEGGRGKEGVMEGGGQGRKERWREGGKKRERRVRGESYEEGRERVRGRGREGEDGRGGGREKNGEWRGRSDVWRE